MLADTVSKAMNVGIRLKGKDLEFNLARLERRREVMRSFGIVG